MNGATYVNHLDHRFMIPSGAQIMYTGGQFAGYTMAGNTITINEMKAASTGMHSYYAKTVGAIATPNVANIGETAGMAAAAESMNETYVMYGGKKIMIPTGAQILYGKGETFAGYSMAGGEMVSAATLMATSTGMHTYYNKDAVTVGMNAGKIGVIAGNIGV